MSTTSTDFSSRRRRAADPQEAVRAELRELGVRPRKSWGQSFLADSFVADAEAALVSAPRSGRVLEVGGGLGVLTAALLRRGFSRVHVVERDRRLCNVLRQRFANQIEVTAGDALAVEWEHPAAVVGNFPFSVATLILFRAFTTDVPEMVGLVQREVAERLAASPGSHAYGRLSISAALYGTVELFQVVPPESFVPPPAVSGRLIRFTRRPGALPVPTVAAFESLLAKIFSSRRKQLKNLLPRVIPPHRNAGAVALAAGWPRGWGNQRPGDLAPEQYFALARALGQPA